MDDDKNSALGDFLISAGFRSKPSSRSEASEEMKPSEIPVTAETEGDEAVQDKGALLRKRQRPKRCIMGAGILAAAALAAYGLFYFLEPKPPAPDVVASYNGKVITVRQFDEFIAVEEVRSKEHMICDIHGYDHSKCTMEEPCEQHPVDGIEEYHQAVKMMAVEQIIMDWADSNGITAREDVQHGVMDLIGDASVYEMMSRIHDEELTPDSIPKWEIQQYYDANKMVYKDKALAEVEEEIRTILLAKKDEEYFPEYINRLKETSGLTVDFELLKITEPAEQEIKEYYVRNLSEFQKNTFANVQQILLESSEKASEAVIKLNSGESFEQVAGAYAINNKVDEISIEQTGSSNFMEMTVFRLSKNEISDPIGNEDGTYSIIKMKDITAAGTKSLVEVEKTIKEILSGQIMEREYALKKDEALFSVHSKRYTLGEFYTEYKELPEEYQKMFMTYEEKKELVEQLIAKELLLEETEDESGEADKQHELEELKIQYISQVIHQEEVDGKIEDATEEEMRTYYEKNQKLFNSPSKVKLSLIWISLPEDRKDQAIQKAEEALNLIKDGTDFAEVAKQYSEDGTASIGGEMRNWFYQGFLTPELDEKVFKLQPGEVSSIIESQGGLYIVQVREKEESRLMTYEESAQSIAAHLKEQKHIDLEQGMESEILEEANLRIYNRTLRKLVKERKFN